MAKRKKTTRRRRRPLGGLGYPASEHAAQMSSSMERAERELAAMKAAGDNCSLAFDRYDKARWSLASAEEHRRSGDFAGRWIEWADTLKRDLETSFFKKCKVVARPKR